MARLGRWPDKPPAREWQYEALQTYKALNPLDFLCVATPGAGKTRFALKVAHLLIESRLVERVAVVTPTDHLRRQWADDAARVGLQLHPNWGNDAGPEPPDFHGTVVTYQQVAANPGLHRKLCDRSTFAVLDEIHHAGDGRTWGRDLRYAFDNATRRLALSGTPFRTDNTSIPFVRYADNVCQPDYVYDYAAALRSGDVVRDVYFQSYEGDMQWLSDDDEQYRASFADELEQKQVSERLRTALSASGNWLIDVVLSADNRLRELRRNGHPDAGGLVICSDQAHARGVAAAMARTLGERPFVAISDDPDASSVIKAFGESSQRWLVAVKMVSEGVDIPRLRVGVFASNVTTELFFRQAVGRFVRWLSYLEGPQPAYVFFPKDARLVALTQTIQNEQDRVIAEITERAARMKADDDELPGRASRFQVIGAQAFQDALYDASGEMLDPEYLRRAGTIQTSFMPGMTIEQVARILQAQDDVQGKRRRSGMVPRRAVTDTVPAYAVNERLRSNVRRLVGSLNFRSGEEFGSIYRRINSIIGVSELRQANEQQLRLALQLVAQWLSAAPSQAGVRE